MFACQAKKIALKPDIILTLKDMIDDNINVRRTTVQHTYLVRKLHLIHELFGTIPERRR